MRNRSYDRPPTIGEARIVAWLREHAGHWLFVGTSVGGPYIGCNNCCSVTTPQDWPRQPASTQLGLGLGA
jgi:hypothetical protein